MKLLIMCVLWIAQCECFIRLPSDHNVHFKDEIVVVVKECKRTKRSAVNDFHPQSYDLDFETDGKGVHLNLIRNDRLQTNVPTLLLNENGLQDQRMEDTEESVFYQDSQHGAAFVVQYNERSKNMFGIFNTEKGEYILQSSDVNTSLHHQGFSNFEVMKEKHEHVEYGDYLHDDDSFKTSRNHHIHKRATGDNQIELLIVCDYAIYEHWYVKSTKPTQSEKETDALTTVRQYYAFVINGMDAMYKNIQISSYTISILFAGIVIAQSPDNSTWTETMKNTTFTPNRVDSSDALSNFHNWIITTSGLPGNDHAMLFTRYDLTSSGSTGIVDSEKISGTLKKQNERFTKEFFLLLMTIITHNINEGLAYLGEVCTDNSQSIVEDDFDFMIITTASHELGHSLNAGHDGDQGISCSAADAYIMAPSSSPQTKAATATHPWKFSACSTSSFTSYIDSLGSNCMKTLSSGFDPTALSPYDQSIAGQVYDADTQCAEIYNNSSYMCRSQYITGFSTICTVLWCYDPSTEGTCRTHIAGEGTLCGSQKWCVSGVCTANSSAPSGNDACLYGDRKGEIFDNGWTCADMVAAAPNYCNIVPVVCCASCAPETTTQKTTTQSETNSIITTTQVETTTRSVTTTPGETSIPEVTTTQDDTTTPEVTTTQAETSTPEITTTEAETTTPDITTTQAQTKTPEVTTTQVDTTITEMTATQAETTTQARATIKQETTTQELATTQADTTTPEVTSTQDETTTPAMTVTQSVTATQTIRQTVTTTQPDTTTHDVTTTEHVTTKQDATTTQAQGTTTELDTTADDSTNTQELILIGTGAAVGGIIILGIGIACFTVCYKRLNKPTTADDYKSDTYPAYLAAGHTNAGTEYDEIVDTWSERKSQRSAQNRNHMMNYELGHSSSGPSGPMNIPAWNPQYNTEDRISWNKFDQKGVRVYDNSGYY